MKNLLVVFCAMILVFTTTHAIALEYSITDLGTLGGTTSYAYGINNIGQIVGKSRNSNGDFHAFSYESGQISDLGTLYNGYSYAFDVNDGGQVVGGIDAGVVEHAFLYQNGSMSDLGSLYGGSADANSINSYGQIVGYSRNASGYLRAYSYDNGLMTDLDTLGGDEAALCANEE